MNNNRIQKVDFIYFEVEHQRIKYVFKFVTYIFW